ncbi:MAG: metal-dependent transcriptional regulator [Spirochaetaceae bacterium]|jgi:DtxR family Mn-dependent transcriptional regulator|nr:metal-dependent transcriptional regulator [Spirochaetaceae bacterium]
MTQSLEDYLEMISFLADEGAVRVTDIALRLGVSKPSVLSALKNLEEKGFIVHEHYGNVRLTDAGIQRANLIRGRHHDLTNFLVQALGVKDEIAEKDACQMEHFLSAETLSAMKAFLSKR